jgi:hypothetical protein
MGAYTATYRREGILLPDEIIRVDETPGGYKPEVPRDVDIGRTGVFARVDEQL